MVLLAALVLARISDPLARYAALRASHPTLLAGFSASINGTVRTSATLLIQRPASMLYKAHGKGYEYSLSLTDKGYLEIEKAFKIYDEYPAPGRLLVYNSDINPAANSLLPKFLLFPELHGVPPKGRVITHKGDQDEIYASQATQFGKFEFWVDIDSMGRLVRYKMRGDTPSGPRTTEWDFTVFSFPVNLNPSTFITPIPLGYVPHALPRLTDPLQMGETAPLSGWVSPAGTRVDLGALAKHKPLLIAVLGDDSPPSEACRPSLARLNSHLPVFVVGRGGYRDPGGKLMGLLNPAGWPMFYLIDGKGKVLKLWMGYDPATSAKFEADVVAAAAPNK